MNFTLKLFSFYFVPLLASNPGDSTDAYAIYTDVYAHNAIHHYAVVFLG